MKRQDIAKLHTATPAELQKKLLDLQQELVKQRLNIKLGKQKNTRITSSLRRDIARINTIITEQSLTPAAPEPVKDDTQKTKTTKSKSKK